MKFFSNSWSCDFLLFIALMLFPVSCGQGDSSTESGYKNPENSVEQRVNDLLSQMTLEEKLMQTQFRFLNYRENDLLDSSKNFSISKADSLLKNGVGMIGMILWDKPIQEYALDVNAFQQYLLKKTRLGIPAFVFGEGLHGFREKDAIHFPQAIALASSWDTSLIKEIFSHTALEMRARGVNQSFNPVLGLAREPRWGRTEELYSEDPYLTAMIGLAAVKGLQGNGPDYTGKVASTIKHYAVHSQPEGGLNTAPCNFSEHVIRENFLYPFEIAVKEGEAMSVMAAYNEVNGIPVHTNEFLLQEVLRKEWGFNGYLMSDLQGVRRLVITHRVAANNQEAARMALTAGIDFELGREETFLTLDSLFRNKLLEMELLDSAVARILRIKFKLGLFENPFADTTIVNEITQSESARALALKAAHESAILLKNNGILPLVQEKGKKIAVIGPNAKDIHLGGYSYEPNKGISVLQGLMNEAKVEYATGCLITKEIKSDEEKSNPSFNSARHDEKLIKEAVQVASRNDLVVLCVGGNEITAREAWNDEYPGDRDELNLPGRQSELFEAIYKTGKPIVVVLINGRPLTINNIAKKADAILECWYLGQETGVAVADILFGKVNPSGKLTVTIPRSVGQLPVYYNRKPSRSRKYLFTEHTTPLFPFGFGLSYTKFSYSDIDMKNDTADVGETIQVSVDITNTGKYKGDEIVQLYIHDKVSSMTRPVMELKDFARITLSPGETKKVNFVLVPEKFQFHDKSMNRIIEPGDFEIMIGTSSANYKSTLLTLKK